MAADIYGKFGNLKTKPCPLALLFLQGPIGKDDIRRERLMMIWKGIYEYDANFPDRCASEN